jgi:hypothetical protein
MGTVGACLALLAATCTGAEPVYLKRPPAVTPRPVAVDVGGHPGRLVVDETGVWVTVFRQGPDHVVRVDSRTNRVTARVPVRGGPFAIAAGAGALWVTGNFSRRDDVLYRIDPKTNGVAATIGLPGRYAGKLAATDGGVWVVVTGRHATSSSLVRIDPGTNAVARIVPLPRGRWVDGIAVDDDAVWLLALRAGPNGELPGDVLRLDPRTYRMTTTIDADALTMGLGEGGLWATGCVDCGVHRRTYFAQRLDLMSVRLAVRRVGFGLLFAGRERVWFGGYENASATIAFRLDPARRRIDRFLRIGRFYNSGMAFDRDSRTLWVARATGDVLRLPVAGR